jgi:hypothetical protein
MTFEQLQAMSDSELNELSAVKVMGWEYQNKTAYSDNGEGIMTYIGAWEPTTDMNDCFELLERFHDFNIRKYNNGESYNVMIITNDNDQPKNCLLYEGVNKLQRAITIASILAKGE